MAIEIRDAGLIGLALILLAASCSLGLRPAVAASQETGGSKIQTSQDAKEQSDNNGQDFTRPQNLFQLRNTYETAPGTTRQVTHDTLTLRADRWFNLCPQWQLALRMDLPFVAKNAINSENPDGDFIYGFGDAYTQAALIRTFDPRWAAAIGMRLITPTGQENLTSDKWRLMPQAAVRSMLPEIAPGSYFTALARYDQSIAGDAAAKTISNLQFAPTLNVSLPDEWFITFYPNPDIRVNFGDPVTGQTGRLFLPFDAMIGRKLTKNLTTSLEVGVPIVKDYPVYNFKTEARLNYSY
jgi:hypothetical protein